MKYPLTSVTLINGLKSGSDVSWSRFYAQYASVVYNVGKSKGLTDDECNDLVQDVMLRFFKQQEKFDFDPNVAKFRTYFGKIVSGKIVDIFRKRWETKGTLTSEDEFKIGVDESTVSEIDSIFIENYRKMILERSKDMLREKVDAKTYQAFELFAEQGRDIKLVSEILNMSPNQIYVAKNRCIASLKKIIQELHDADPELGLMEGMD